MTGSPSQVWHWHHNIRIVFVCVCVCVCVYTYVCIFSHGATAPSGPRTHRYRGFTITQKHTPLGWTHLDEWSARRSDLYWTTNNTLEKYSRFEPAIPTSERPQTHALERAATGIDMYVLMYARMNTLCVRIYKRMGTLCMHVRNYVMCFRMLRFRQMTGRRLQNLLKTP